MITLDTVIGLDAPPAVRVIPPLLDVQVAALLVIGVPLPAPGTNDTVNGPVDVVVDPEMAETPLGADGTSEGTIAFECPDAGPVPTPFVALTEQVYVLPSVTPVTVIALAAALATRVEPPLLDVHVAVKLVMANPLPVPGVNGTRKPAPERVTVPTVGALGTVAGMIAFEFVDCGPAPIAFVA